MGEGRRAWETGHGTANLPTRDEARGVAASALLIRCMEVVLRAECSKMTLSMDGHPVGVSRQVTYLSASSRTRPAAGAGRGERLNDPWACQIEGQLGDLKRQIPILKRLIADCDRLAADLNQEVQNEEDRVKIHNPAHCAYPPTPRLLLRGATT